MQPRSPARFALLFVGWSVALYAASSALDEPARRSTARLLGTWIGLVNDRATVEGTIVQDAHRRFDIVSDCTALFPLLLLAAGILATPAPLRRRATALALGALALLTLNQVRLVTLWIVRGAAPSKFDFAHLYLWQPVMLAAVVFGWLVWLQRVRLTAAQ